MTWTWHQQQTLEKAEARARAGERPADICAALSIPPSTYSRWARLHGFRRGDLFPDDGRARAACAPGPVVAPSSWTGSGTLSKAGEAEPSEGDMLARGLAGADLKAEAFAMTHGALALLKQGKGVQADTKLRTAERLLRINRQIGGDAEPDPNEGKRVMDQREATDLFNKSIDLESLREFATLLVDNRADEAGAIYYAWLAREGIVLKERK